MFSYVDLHEAAMEDLLNTPESPVGETIDELSHKAADIAEALTPVMEARSRRHMRRAYDPLYQYGPPGATKKSVRPSGFRFNGLGQMYSGVNVNYGPTAFLEFPARQYKGSTEWMFMTHALEAIEI